MDYLQYQGKVCVVTGASSGMGKATAEMLVENGAIVYGLDVVSPDTDRYKYVQVDLSKKESIDAAFEVLPEKFDCFFGAAGITGNKKIFNTVFNINFTSNKYMIDHYFPERMNKGGSVAIIASMAGINWDKYRDEFQDIALAKDWDPQCGFEDRGPLIPAMKKKKVAVVGGGPAGMEAARVAALRGHEVVLYEKNDELGGNVLPASVPEFKKDLEPMIHWQSRQLKNLQVTVKKNTKIEKDSEELKDVDAIVIATGATPLKFRIPGIDGENVVTGIDVLNGKSSVKNTVGIAGGGFVGSEVALWLSQQGKKVSIIELKDDICGDSANAITLKALLAAAGVEVHTKTKIQEFTDDGIFVIDENKNLVKMECESIVLAMGMASENQLYTELEDSGREVYLIGDAKKSARVGEAIRAGFDIGTIL